MENSKIGISRQDIIVKDAKVIVSDEKFKNLLAKSYEAARKDARKFKIYKYFGVFFSIAISLLIALLTADFKALGRIPSEWVMGIAIFFCVACFIIGFILLILYSIYKDSAAEDERDKAVENIINEMKKSD